jgi:beta-N-acetylhexosaminidase
MKKIFLYSFFLFSFIGVQAQRDSLDIKIGQMILVGMPKAEVDSAVLDEVQQGKIGSLIYFEDNIPKSPSAFAALKKISWTYQKVARIPLFICIDQEGGKVNRLREKYGFARSISAEAIGKSKSFDSVRFYSEATASTLAGLGINVNFAPCVDLATNPNNPVIAKIGRAYSANEDTVILFAKEVVKQHRRFGIVTALKHFPGHGSSKDDTHLGLTDVTNTWSSRELKPYQSLIDSGYVDGIMSSHIVNKKLDRNALPGTLSKSVLDSMLRKRMHYQGVVFSDAMEMKAISANYGLEEAIKLSVNAGIDILCFAHNIAGADSKTGEMIHGLIRKFVVSGEIPKYRIDESFRRIMKLKKSIQKTQLERLYNENQRLVLQMNQASSELKKANEEIQELKQPQKKSKKKKKVKS